MCHANIRTGRSKHSPDDGQVIAVQILQADQGCSTCVYRSASSSQASLSVWYRSTYLRSRSMAPCRLPSVFSLPICSHVVSSQAGVLMKHRQP